MIDIRLMLKKAYGARRGWQSRVARHLHLRPCMVNAIVHGRRPFPPRRLSQLENYVELCINEAAVRRHRAVEQAIAEYNASLDQIKEARLLIRAFRQQERRRRAAKT